MTVVMSYKILVYTGDKPSAGTDANVNISLHDEAGRQTPPYKLDARFRDDFERGNTDDFEVKLPSELKLGKLKKIELWRDSAWINPSWFVDRISVTDNSTQECFEFPVFRWIKVDQHYLIQHLDTSLPQQDEHEQQRQQELEGKRKVYLWEAKAPGMPNQAVSLPDDEQFSETHKSGIQKLKIVLKLDTVYAGLISGKWTDLDSMRSIFATDRLQEPECTKYWRTDWNFGNQRVTGVNPIMIRLCTAIPDKLGVTDEMVKPSLEGLTLQEAIAQKRLFIEDLEILEGIPCQNDSFVLCSPIALFFENSNKQLLPVAIQLFQNKGADNQVFLPSDQPLTWLVAKMWFNNADSAYHQAVTHLAQTHLIMEGICIAAHRNLSQSHPIFKLLAPHFMYLIAINARGLEMLISEGGWIDNVQSIGRKGTFALAAKRMSTWRMDKDGIIPEELKQRGLLDNKILSYYPYRDDVMLLYELIHSYVAKMVNLYYDSGDKLLEDYEIQSWAEEIVKPKEQGGCGVLGVPGNGRFIDKEQLVLVLSCIISTCSVTHAAVNFPQYETYSYAPNYPLMMYGKPPQDKETKITETDIVNSLPQKRIILDTILVAKVLSEKSTNSLGDFDVNYAYDPKALEIIEWFKTRVREITEMMKERNKNRLPYEWLIPEFIPNSISI